MKQCIVCFSSFIINKTPKWKCGQFWDLSSEGVRHYPDTWLELFGIVLCALKMTQRRPSYYHLQADVQAS